MENHETLIYLLAAGLIIIGIIGSLAYYFARYGTSGGAGPHPESIGSTETVTSPAATEAVVPSARLDQALAKTKAGLWGRISSLLSSGGVPDSIKDQIEEILYTSDLGVATVGRLMAVLDERLNRDQRGDVEQVRATLKTAMLEILSAANKSENDEIIDALKARTPAAKPLVWLIVGVNGVGKTTTIGKLAFVMAQSGKRVLVAAGDTFRAAAGSQLKVWSERAQVEIFSPEGVTDPAAVAYSAVETARAKEFDIVIIDTAGRLHTQSNLMEELKKVKRVLTKQDPSVPHETLLVLDANSGQNAIVQAKEFHKALELTGVILTKMDGTAKGGVALSLAQELGLPPRLIGVGEGVNDLRPFAAQAYVDAIL